MILIMPRWLGFCDGSIVSVCLSNLPLCLCAGDIVIPGLALSMALRQDYYSKRAAVMPGSGLTGCAPPCCELVGRACPCFRPCGPRGVGYYPIALLGYALGLSLANAAVALMEMGQPALLYLVPCIMSPLIFIAWRRGELELWWRAPADDAERRHHQHDASGAGALGAGGAASAGGVLHDDDEEEEDGVTGGVLFGGTTREERQRRSDSLLASEFSTRAQTTSDEGVGTEAPFTHSAASAARSLAATSANGASTPTMAVKAPSFTGSGRPP